MVRIFVRIAYVAASWPPVAAASAAMLVHPGWRNAAILCVLSTAGLLWNLNYLARTNIGVLERLKHGYLAPFTHCRFRSAALDSLLCAPARESAAWRPEGLPVRPPRIFRVESGHGNPVSPCTLSTYPLIAFPGLIFLPPLWSETNPLHRFWLHHEVGHASVAQYSLLFRDGVQAFFLVLLGIATALLSPSPLPLIVLGGFWVYWQLRAERPQQKDVEGEIVGDVYAINHLEDAAEADWIDDLYPFFLQHTTNQAAAARQIAAFRRNLALFRPVLAFPPDERERIGMTYVSHAVGLLAFRNLAGRLALLAVTLWIGTRFTPPSTGQLLALVFLTVVAPGIWTAFVLARHQHLLDEVEEILGSRRPSPADAQTALVTGD